MRILCAPDSFKESLAATEVVDAMVEGVHDAAPDADVDRCPLADGGEGTLEVLGAALGATIEELSVTGPLGEPVRARLGLIGPEATAIVELAEASGLSLVPEGRRDPTATTTYGTGQLIRRAVELGCRRVICAIGGSATVDGGAGLCQALGAVFRDDGGRVLPTPMTGASLALVASIERPDRLPVIDVACDVTNPLTGADGAATVYGPQKGATEAQVAELETGLRTLARVAGVDSDFPAAGAAGGAGFGLHALLGARLHRGIDLVLDTIMFDTRCRDATLVLTGEGRLDAQSARGKAVLGATRVAAACGVPTIAIVGDTGPGADRCVGRLSEGLLERYVSLTGRFGRPRALAEPATLIRRVTAELITGHGRHGPGARGAR